MRGTALTLLRDSNTPDGVFGTLKVPFQRTAGRGSVVLQTMEDDWLFNRRGVSSIPPGVYELKRTIFQKHMIETFEVTGVPGRSRILLHVANTEEDVEGCIGLGLYRGHLWVPDEDAAVLAGQQRPKVYKLAVLDSKPAFARFMEQMSGVDSAPLTVRWIPGLDPAGELVT